MTDKQKIIKEITECGFYYSKDDVEHLYIYEVIKNTDKEWLKENPEATLLIDEWIYDYTDYDDRKVYYTSGNLIDVCNASTCEVYKIEDTKYKIYGNCGQFLIEDKPTYKEQLKAKEQECEELKEQLKEMNEVIRTETTRCSLVNSLKTELGQLKAENDELKKQLMQKSEVDMFFNIPIEGWSSDPCGICKYKNYLTEIKEIAERDKEFCIKCNGNKEIDCVDCIEGGRALLAKEILQKISEYEGNDE